MAPSTTYNIPWLVEQLHGFEEKTIRRYLDKFLAFMDIDKSELKDTRGQMNFDKELGEYLVWLFKNVDRPFLRKSLHSSDKLSFQDVIEFQRLLREYVMTLDEPSRIHMLRVANDLELIQSKMLFEKTMEDINKLLQLFGQLPPMDRVSLLQKLHPHLESWIIDLEQRLPENLN